VTILVDIKVEVFKAKCGESILVTCLDSSRNKHILIDMGFASTYQEYIKKRLKEISEEGILDLLVFTHIDGDHIAGGIKFLQENGNIRDSKKINIGDIWYNGLRHITPFSNREKLDLNSSQKGALETRIFRGMEIHEDIEDQPISGRQGSILGGLILNGGYNWNSAFNSKAVCSNLGNNYFEFDGIKFEILSPEISNLKNLEAEWLKELENIGLYKVTHESLFDDAFEALTFEKFENYFVPVDKPICSKDCDIAEYISDSDYEDSSLKNASSISFILEYRGKRLLFLGDSHPDTIISSLTAKDRALNKPEYFDLVKIAHHGSCGNTNIKLLEIIDSEKYIIPTDGSVFRHPDIQTIAQIVCRPTKKERILYFNHENICDKFRKLEWMDKHNYKVPIVKGEILEILI
jgi:metal-dependent hydrolase (beta-lactamase superfamily II)